MGAQAADVSWLRFGEYGRHCDRPGDIPGLVWMPVDSAGRRYGFYRVSADGRSTELVGQPSQNPAGHRA